MAKFISFLVKTLVALTLVLVVVWFLLPGLLKPHLEDLASQAYGAQIDVGELSLGLFPVSLGLSNIDATDKAQPSHNAVSIRHVDLELEFGPLLASNVIIPVASVNGIAFGSERPSEGFVLDQIESTPSNETGNPLSEYFEGLNALGDLENLDAKTLLAKEPLKSIELANQLTETFDNSKAELEALKAKLPEQDELKSLESQIKTITDRKISSLADVQQSKAKLDTVLGKVKALKETASQAKDLVSKNSSLLSEELVKLKQYTEQDLEYLKNKYTFDVAGLSNLTTLLFEEAAGEWVRKAYDAYQLVEPFIGDIRKSQSDVAADPIDDAAGLEDEDLTTPDFLIQTLKVTDLAQDDINFDFVATNITHQQDRVGVPLKLDMSGVTANSDFNLKGVLDRLTDQARDDLEWNINQWPLPQFDLGLEGAVIEASSLVTQGNLNRTFEGLDGAFTGELMDLVYQLIESSEGDQSFGSKFLSEVLKSVQAVDFSGAISGTEDNPNWSLRSNLDRQINDVLKRQITSSNSTVNQALTAALSEKLAGSNESLEDYREYLGGANLNIGELDASLEGMLDAKVDGFKDQAKDKLESKLKDKLNKLF